MALKVPINERLRFSLKEQKVTAKLSASGVTLHQSKKGEICCIPVANRQIDSTMSLRVILQTKKFHNAFITVVWDKNLGKKIGVSKRSRNQAMAK